VGRDLGRLLLDERSASLPADVTATDVGGQTAIGKFTVTT